MFVLLATYGNFESQSQKKMDKKKKKNGQMEIPLSRRYFDFSVQIQTSEGNLQDRIQTS